MTYWIYDAVIAVVLLVFFLRGRSKGLVLSLCGLLAVFVALVGAKMTSGQAKTLLPEDKPAATECIKCGKCEGVCPQNISIKHWSCFIV